MRWEWYLGGLVAVAHSGLSFAAGGLGLGAGGALVHAPLAAPCGGAATTAEGLGRLLQRYLGAFSALQLAAGVAGLLGIWALYEQYLAAHFAARKQRGTSLFGTGSRARDGPSLRGAAFGTAQLVALAGFLVQSTAFGLSCCFRDLGLQLGTSASFSADQRAQFDAILTGASECSLGALVCAVVLAVLWTMWGASVQKVALG